ncbi:MAG: biotin--[acetyl-CoA-carboxylase] ligase [Bacilli bacterium]
MKEFNYIHFAEIDSTSSYLKRHYKELEDLTLVSASLQTSGHGRMNRKWINKKDENLMFSLLIKDKSLVDKFANFSLASAVCVFNTLLDFKINNVSIKWPNDVYVNDKKICGILLESISYNEGIEALIIGIGINVNSSFKDNELFNKATSLFELTNNLFDINEVSSKVYKYIYNMLIDIKNNDKSYLKIVRDNNYLRNKYVYCLINNKEELVKVLDINDDNSLKILLNNDEVNISSSEVTFTSNKTH